MTESVQVVIIASLKEMGLGSAPGALPCTLALSEGRLVARKVFYEGGYAVWVAECEMINFYDEAGKLLKTVALDSVDRKHAA